MTQNEWVLDTLKSRPLTTLEALEQFGIFRLASRINDLRDDGHRINTVTVKLPSGKNVAKYFLQTEMKAAA